MMRREPGVIGEKGGTAIPTSRAPLAFSKRAG